MKTIEENVKMLNEAIKEKLSYRCCLKTYDEICFTIETLFGHPNEIPNADEYADKFFKLLNECFKSTDCCYRLRACSLDKHLLLDQPVPADCVIIGIIAMTILDFKKKLSDVTVININFINDVPSVTVILR